MRGPVARPCDGTALDWDTIDGNGADTDDGGDVAEETPAGCVAAVAISCAPYMQKGKSKHCMHWFTSHDSGIGYRGLVVVEGGGGGAVCLKELLNAGPQLDVGPCRAVAQRQVCARAPRIGRQPHGDGLVLVCVPIRIHVRVQHHRAAP